MAGAYEVTATRKRPQDFDRLVGQDFVVSTLENAIKENRIAHAYLFSGPRGVGKTSSARLLAKALNCEKGPTPHPCGVCDSCRSIAEGKSVDVIEIDGASNTSVNDIRTIREEVLYPPQSSRYKIYIIDEVHMLSTSAFNALLKTIAKYLASVIGNPVSVRSITDYLISNGRKIEHDFRTVQRECLSMSDAEVESYHSGSRKIDEGLRGRLQGIFRRKLAADSRRNGNGYESLVNPKTNRNSDLQSEIPMLSLLLMTEIDKKLRTFP